MTNENIHNVWKMMQTCKSRGLNNLARTCKTILNEHYGQFVQQQSKDDFIEDKSDEWFSAQQERGCSCPMGNPPCSFCTDGYSLTLAEYLELALQEEYGDDFAKDPHEDYDRAMKDLF